MDCIKQYMRHRNVPDEMQDRVKKYFKYTWTRSVQDNHMYGQTVVIDNYMYVKQWW